MQMYAHGPAASDPAVTARAVEQQASRPCVIQAAVGREQLKRLPEIVERRRVVANRYRELLSGLAALRCPPNPIRARSNWQSHCVCLPPHRDQRRVMQHLLDRRVASKPERCDRPGTPAP
jgi:dTDP-4-amino-4,6-dideoxygalactose transaminase